MKTVFNHYDTFLVKGIGILLVVLCHVGGNHFRMFTPLGGIGVSLFLFISAYGLEKSYIAKSQKKSQHGLLVL